MVAAAAMAGVPLLNGFLSKEMFFAEARGHADSILDIALPYVATLASVFSVAYSLRFIHGVFFGPPADGLPRTPHEPPHWMRFPVEFLVSPACGRHLPGADHRAVPRHSGALGPGAGYARIQPRGLARLQHSAADERDRPGRRRSSTWRCSAICARASTAPPLLRRLKGQRIFERLLVTCPGRWARRSSACSARAACSRNCGLLRRLSRCSPACWPLYRHGLRAGPLAAQASIPPSRCSGSSACACALGAA